MLKTLLVNKNNKIKDTYLNKINLVKTKDIDNNDIYLEEDIDNNDIYLEEETYNSYLKLRNFLLLKNIEIGISSAYRSITNQIDIYRELKEMYGEEYAKLTVATPGYSEHHTGLAIDINIKVDGKYPQNNKELEQQAKYYENIFKYLKDFGFILRYPKGKEKITGYNYEPWHIRYVGFLPANLIMNNNLTLEEYLINFSGVIALNKKSGPTSRDYVNEISKIFGLKKVGHTGTLDPLAEGVLLITIGKATKIAELLTSTYKEYIAEVIMGIKTDTYDIEGKIIEKANIPENINLSAALNHFQTTYLQQVPIYSAIKVNGKKLYEYARNNEKIELPKKNVTIKKIELLSKSNNKFTFRAIVSKGCYIRSLINDIGLYLNIPMTMSKLTRISQGDIRIEESYTLEDIRNNNFKLLSIEKCLNYPVIILDKDLAFKVSNGVPIKNNFNIKDKVIFQDQNSKLLGIYQVKNNMLVTWKNF